MIKAKIINRIVTISTSRHGQMDSIWNFEKFKTESSKIFKNGMTDSNCTVAVSTSIKNLRMRDVETPPIVYALKQSFRGHVSSAHANLCGSRLELADTWRGVRWLASGTGHVTACRMTAGRRRRPACWLACRRRPRRLLTGGNGRTARWLATGGHVTVGGATRRLGVRWLARMRSVRSRLADRACSRRRLARMTSPLRCWLVGRSAQKDRFFAGRRRSVMHGRRPSWARAGRRHRRLTFVLRLVTWLQRA